MLREGGYAALKEIVLKLITRRLLMFMVIKMASSSEQATGKDYWNKLQIRLPQT